MIVFTITNDITDQVYVATTKKSPQERWAQFKKALPLGINAKIYDDIRAHGAENFSLAEFGVAMDRDHSRELVTEACELFDGISLQGVKTKLSTAAPVMPKRVASPGKEKSSNRSLDEVTAIIAAAAAEQRAPKKTTSSAETARKPTEPPPARKPDKPKLASGRAASSSKEKRIKELIAEEKAAIQAAKQQRVAAEKDEMAALMARIDSRASSAYRRRR